MVAKLKARFEGQTINPEEEFGYCSSVIYTIKIKQVGETILVKHDADKGKNNIKKYSNFIEFLKDWNVRLVYP